jgi:hypothetical protein
MVRAAQRVQRIGEVAIRRPPVMNRDSAEGAQHASGKHRLDAALAVHPQQRQHLG